MQWIKLFEGFEGVSIRRRFPSDEEISTAISLFVKKYPSHDIIQNILQYIRTIDDTNFQRDDLLDYDTIYRCISTPSKRHGSGLVKGDFVKNYYEIMRMSVGENIEIIEDAFLDIHPGVRVNIKPVSGDIIDRYTVILLGVKEDDIPGIIKTIFKSSSKRLPDGHRMGEIKINGSSIKIDIIDL